MIHIIKKGFTLIELLIVIAIIGVIVAMILPNLAGARERARDSRRKTDLHNIQQALRMYYNDTQAFPTTAQLTALWGSPLTNPTTSTTYMSQLPYDPTSGTTTITYDYVSDGNTYILVATLENKSDPDIASSHAKCSGPDTEFAYVVCEE